MPDTEVHARIRRLFKEGELFDAYDRVRRRLSAMPDDVTLLELRARAEERLGLDGRLSKTLDQLEALAPKSEELHGFRGKLYKRRARAATGDVQRQHWEHALEAYERGYTVTGGYWTGINVALLHHFLGNVGRASKVARNVQHAVEEILEGQDPESEAALWSLGTLGDALLIQGNLPEAVARYAALRRAAVGHHALDVLSSVRRSALEVLGASDLSAEDVATVKEALRAPRLALCVGHMIDQPGRDEPRFPAANADAVARAIDTVIQQNDVRHGISSMANGTDLIFQEALLGRGLRRHMVLPYPMQPFRKVSVEPGGKVWRTRFDSAWDADRASQVLPHRMDAEGLEFRFCTRFAEGLAQMRAEQVGGELVRIAVWDGKPGDGRGGTADAVRMWRSIPGIEFQVIDPLTAEVRTERVETPTARVVDNQAGSFAICALLFADAQGFSKLDEAQNLAFVNVFLGGIAKIANADAYHAHIRVRNTWGDALFMVMDDVALAGHFALDLRDHIAAPAQREAFREAGLPDEMNLRIALHAAVVHLVVDPITGVERVAGAQVSQAARIEPVTPAGQVYASEAFAAVSRADQAEGFRCDYLGKTTLAKNFGEFPTYHVRRDE